MKSLSVYRQLQISNICYANVSGLFALLNNPKYVGEKFSWDNFVDICKERSDDWILIHHIKGDKDLIRNYAKQSTEDIASYLVQRLRK